MTGCSAATGRVALLVSGLLLGGLLAGCDDATQPPPATGTASAAAAPGPAPRPVAASPVRPSDAGVAGPAVADAGDAAAATGTEQNDPSAPADTPLCGMAAQEADALSRQLLSRQYADAGQCSAFACYDAATATYIGADGYRHVCR